MTFKNFLYKHTSLEAGVGSCRVPMPMETHDVPIEKVGFSWGIFNIATLMGKIAINLEKPLDLLGPTSHEWLPLYHGPCMPMRISKSIFGWVIN